MAIDPICGMLVEETTRLNSEYDGAICLMKPAIILLPILHWLRKEQAVVEKLQSTMRANLVTQIEFVHFFAFRTGNQLSVIS
ncbi:MAG: hypothetical protein CME31_28860 [Gimesia sp.]|nr:hypothetical protein [Gimesia sp.]